MSFEKDGLDYLLISTTYEMQGTAQYDFAAFYVDDEKGIVIEDTYGVEFAVDKDEHQDWNECIHREDVVPLLKEKMTPYLMIPRFFCHLTLIMVLCIVVMGKHWREMTSLTKYGKETISP